MAGNLFLPPVAQLLPLLTTASPVSRWVLLITNYINTMEIVSGVGVEESLRVGDKEASFQLQEKNIIVYNDTILSVRLAGGHR